MTAQMNQAGTVVDGFVLVHRTLISTGRQIAIALHRTPEGHDLPGLARVWRLYRAGLAEHHEGESAVVFPLVGERDPAFAELAAAMDGEHEEIDALLDAADQAVDAAVSDRAPAIRHSAAEAVDALIASLGRHLEREEALVLPHVVAAISSDEMDEIERGFVRRIGPRRLATTVASLEQTARREGLPMPPLPLPARLALPIWRRRYLRLLAGAGIEATGGAS